MSRGGLTLSTSTLYDALTRLMQQGLIERVDEQEDNLTSKRPRKLYRLTKLGRRMLEAEVHRMKAWVAVAEPRLEAGKP